MRDPLPHGVVWCVRPDVVFDDAFRGIVEDVRRAVKAGVFLGSPEA